MHRFQDVGCLDFQRVVINIGPVSYIHANYVATPLNPRRFICTQGSKKSAEYVPLSFDTSPLAFGDVTVTLRKREEFQFPFNTRVNVDVGYLEVKIKGEPPHHCTHYHWKDWPDRGVPEADLAPIYLLTKIQSTPSAHVKNLNPHAVELINSQAPLTEIRALLLNLRKQRNNSIQTEHQYLYVHQVLLLYLKKLKYLDDSVIPYLEQFTADYQAATKGF
ncbi:unnamed protein product [Angiostrongylus costaricensis]|uniref:Tyrosine-protein phosphatase domain-containing protein n=1 Tax=Angiostrongylus costaricensis TaxID=334426 RepID=A0A0R3PCT6_ANGCS|nr:unnamed protein product [Angiostrongylus costaricensis]